MKAGILTLHTANNYGALLQAYALSKTLASLGAEPEFISLPEKKTTEQPSENKSGSGGPLARILLASAKKRDALFDTFRHTYLPLSRPYGWDEAEQLDRDYDCFVSGSDQVFNPIFNKEDGRYYLPFASPEKRYSYAASFGGDPIGDDMRARLAPLLSSFAGLSVREEEGRDLIRQMTGKDAAVHPDPTLLPPLSLWENLAAPAPGEPYLFLYSLQPNDRMLRYASEYAKEHGLRLISASVAFDPFLGMDSWCRTGIPEWVGLMRGASAVVTNSFHGTVFSILFSRPFALFPLIGELTCRNVRLRELLQKTGASEDCLYHIPEKEQDWGKIGERIAAMREGGISYLTDMIRTVTGKKGTP